LGQLNRAERNLDLVGPVILAGADAGRHFKHEATLPATPNRQAHHTSALAHARLMQGTTPRQLSKVQRPHNTTNVSRCARSSKPTKHCRCLSLSGQLRQLVPLVLVQASCL
jgi:hypothetical protein